MRASAEADARVNGVGRGGLRGRGGQDRGGCGTGPRPDVEPHVEASPPAEDTRTAAVRAVDRGRPLPADVRMTVTGLVRPAPLRLRRPGPYRSVHAFAYVPVAVPVSVPVSAGRRPGPS